MTALWLSLYHAAAMLWSTLWALVLGFSFSAILQAFARKEQMERLFGRTGLREVLLAMGIGAASSSCSYAAAAAGRTAFKKGAAFVPMLAFMFASTNLVLELGAVLWLLMGWHFVLAETVGAFVLVGLLWLFVALTRPKRLIEEARRHGEEGSAAAHDCRGHEEEAGHGGHEHQHEDTPAASGRWGQAAATFFSEWSMLWKEIVIGFLIGGFLATLVPSEWWAALFMTKGPWLVRLVENCLVGPLIAVASFICSVGNIPLASLFWSTGISFGGVISFIYADLIIIPLILIYRKYYGGRMAAYMAGLFFVAMALSGIVVDLLFTALHLVPTGPRPENPIEHAHFGWNYTTWLNIAAIALSLGWFLLRPKVKAGEEAHACCH